MSLYEYVRHVLEKHVADSLRSEVSYSQHRGVSYSEVSYQNDSSKLLQSKLSELLKTLIKKVRDIEERVRVIEYVYWGVADKSKHVQVLEGDSEESRKVVEGIRQKGLKPIDRSEDNGVAVEIYEN